MKTIYTCFCTDVIHEGHLHIIEEAHKYGAVIVGALSDRALIRCMRFPTIPFEERVRLYEGLDGVDRVVVQDDMLYDDILAELKPDYVIHGDNWRTGPEAVLRESAIRALAQYGGELIEAPYTVNEEVRAKAGIKPEDVITCRPADLLEPELPKYREEYKDLAKSEEDVLSLALFPQVAEKFIKLRNTRHPLGQRFIKPLEHAEKVERHIAPLSRKK